MYTCSILNLLLKLGKLYLRTYYVPSGLNKKLFILKIIQSYVITRQHKLRAAQRSLSVDTNSQKAHITLG